jgi:hypothetical protein
MAKKIICYILRFKDIADVSDLAVKITDYSGNNDIFPKSQLFDTFEDNTVLVPKWLLMQKSLIYSAKKRYLIDTEIAHKIYNLKTLVRYNPVEIVTHVPAKVDFEQSNPDETLCK